MPRRRPKRLTLWLTDAEHHALIQRSRLDNIPMSRLVESVVSGHLLGRANKGKAPRYRLEARPSVYYQPRLF